MPKSTAPKKSELVDMLANLDAQQMNEIVREAKQKQNSWDGNSRKGAEKTITVTQLGKKFPAMDKLREETPFGDRILCLPAKHIEIGEKLRNYSGNAKMQKGILEQLEKFVSEENFPYQSYLSPKQEYWMARSFKLL